MKRPLAVTVALIAVAVALAQTTPIAKMTPEQFRAAYIANAAAHAQRQADLILAYTSQAAPTPVPDPILPPPPLPIEPPAFTWPGPDADATIPALQAVTLKTPAEVRDLTVTGTLVLENGAELKCRTIRGAGAIRCMATDPAHRVSIVFADVPIAAADVEQLGNGLFFQGTVRIHGASKTPYQRLATEPKAGDTALIFANPVEGWQAGDKLWLPDTRQLLDGERWNKFVPQWETVTVAQVSTGGLVVTLAAPLQFNHEGAHDPDGQLVKLPHVANLTRNVTIRSANAKGVRGHCMFTGRADVDIRNVRFGGLGRATGLADKHRYPVHFCNLIGPVKPHGNGHQFTFEGNVVTCPLDPMPFIWGVVLDNSSYGRVASNVIHNWAGAGLVTLTGREHFNLIESNFLCAIRGNASPRANDGLYGVGIWCHGFNNRVRNNVATSCVGLSGGIIAGAGFDFTWEAASAPTTPVPVSQGSDETAFMDQGRTPILEFAGNEAYGTMAMGTDGYVTRPIGQSVIKDFSCWHTYENAFFAYPIQNVLFDGLWDRGHARALHPSGFHASSTWTSGDYWAGNVTLRKVDSRGRWSGVAGSINTPGNFRIEDSFFQCHKACISIQTPATPGTGAGKLPRRTDIKNVRYAAMPGQPLLAVSMDYELRHNNTDVTLLDEVHVTNHNGIEGDSFRLYYPEQHPTFVVPQTDPARGLIGCPEAGLTNEQAWAKFKVAVAGAVAPKDAVEREGVNGLTVRE